MSSEEDTWLPTRSSLLTRLKNWDDQASWQEFFEAYWKLIYNFARKAGLTEAEAQDVVQETVITVAKKMESFQYNRQVGSFKGWLLQTTRWRIADQFRKRIPENRPLPHPDDETARTGTVERIPDPAAGMSDSAWEEEWKQNLTEAALTRLKRKVSARDYQIFDLYVLKHWSVDDLQKTLGVTVHQVYNVRSRLMKRLKKEIDDLESRPF